MDIYTTLEEAEEEIRRRWQDKVLRQRVAEYLGGDIPEVFRNEPRAVLFRNIIVFDCEFQKFSELARSLKLKPLGLEYIEDKFCTRSLDKLGLGKMEIFERRDKNGNAITRYEKIVDVKANDNKAISQVQTVWGESLVDFHHSLLSANVDECELYDMSDWIQSHGATAVNYYQKFFALFLCFGVLLENFLTNGEESDFTVNIVGNSFLKVKEQFGIAPLVVSIFSNEELKDKICWCYPNCVQESLRSKQLNK
jgi:hypothetical protein